MSKIYLVDDHAMLRDGLRALLEHAGHAVVGEAGDVPEAIADIVRLQPDIVLLDLELDGRSGLELLDELRQRALPTRAIILSMSAAAGNVAEALRLGAAGYLLKGSASVDLMAAIEAVAAGRRYLSAKVTEVLAERVGRRAEVSPLDSLSPRERQILKLVADGCSSARIAEMLHLSPKTVDTYRSRLMEKLNISDIASLVKFAIQHGLTSLD